MTTIVARKKFAAALAVSAALLTLLAPVNSRAAGTIGPGAIIRSPAGQCTQNFVFKDGANALYVATAAHCVNAVGNRVTDSTGVQFGTVVFRRYAGADDFSLIKIDTAFYAQVDPAMRHWGGPTGVVAATNVSAGDLVLQHGYGLVYGSNNVTRPRYGVLWSDNGQEYWAEAPTLFGDSGGPILHEDTGQALGFVNHISVPPWASGGSTTERFLVVLSQNGYNLTLVTATYTQPL